MDAEYGVVVGGDKRPFVRKGGERNGGGVDQGFFDKRRVAGMLVLGGLWVVSKKGGTYIYHGLE